jgi:hypothetical protein
MPDSGRSVVSIQSYTRPFRHVVILREPISRQALRVATERLCGIWGGTRSLILPGKPDRLIDPGWEGALQVFDPDVILLGRGLGGLRRRVRFLSELGGRRLAPFWVGDYSQSMGASQRWAPVPVPIPEPRPLGRLAPAKLRPTAATHVAILGLRVGESDARAVRATNANLPLTTLPSNSPAWDAAQLVPDFPTRANLFAPFLYHSRNDVQTALWLWNLRALRGPMFHGGDVELERHLRVIPAVRARATQIIEYDPLSARGLAFLATRPAAPRRVAVGRLVLSTPRRRLPVGLDRELDSAPVADGEFEMALRPPVIPQPSAAIGSSRREGAYAIEVELSPSGTVGRVTVPSRPETVDLFLGRSASAGAVRSRNQRRQGDVVLGISPFQRRRTLGLAVPTVTEVLRVIAPDLHVSLSDKGRYGRWVARQTDGLALLHELLTDRRSRAVLESLRLTPSDRATQRKFLTFDEMARILNVARSSGQLGTSKRRSAKDRQWLNTWIDDLVGRDLMRFGIRIRCEDCLAKSFLGLGNVGRESQCSRCGKTSFTPARPEMGYQLAEVAHLFLDNDCDVSARALAAMSRRSRGGFTYDFDHLMKWPAEASPREIDFVGTLDGELYLGESKKQGNFDDADFDLLKRLAGKTRAGAIVFASPRECQGGCSIACVHDATEVSATSDTSLSRPRQAKIATLRAALSRVGCRVIVLCRGELEGSLS